MYRHLDGQFLLITLLYINLALFGGKEKFLKLPMKKMLKIRVFSTKFSHIV
jgi:hypothetical protein